MKTKITLWKSFNGVWNYRGYRLQLDAEMVDGVKRLNCVLVRIAFHSAIIIPRHGIRLCTLYINAYFIRRASHCARKIYTYYTLCIFLKSGVCTILPRRQRRFKVWKRSRWLYYLLLNMSQSYPEPCHTTTFITQKHPWKHTNWHNWKPLMYVYNINS